MARARIFFARSQEKKTGVQAASTTLHHPPPLGLSLTARTQPRPQNCFFRNSFSPWNFLWGELRNRAYLSGQELYDVNFSVFPVDARCGDVNPHRRAPSRGLEWAGFEAASATDVAGRRTVHFPTTLPFSNSLGLYPFCSSSPFAFGQCFCLNPVGNWGFPSDLQNKFSEPTLRMTPIYVISDEYGACAHRCGGPLSSRPLSPCPYNAAVPKGPAFSFSN